VTIKEKHMKACMKCAEAWAECSTATRLKVGAIAYKNGHIVAEGYNGLPKGMKGSCEDENGNTRPEVAHAEQNLLSKLMRSNESSVGASVFVTTAPCKNCAIKLVDAEVEAVYYKHDYRCSEGIKYLKENGVIVFKMEN
jgi:dCMP deaminase